VVQRHPGGFQMAGVLEGEAGTGKARRLCPIDGARLQVSAQLERVGAARGERASTMMSHYGVLLVSKASI